MIFYIFLFFLAIQRLAELRIAKQNETWMMERGAKEYGKSHYPIMVSIHIGFFLSLIIEVVGSGQELNKYWLYLLTIFIIVQIGRVWVIASLGKYWNTKIIVLPGARVIAKGPFKYIKHPNYLIVTIELLIIPLMFNAYITAVLFFVLNFAILSVRIPIEEKALKENTNYK